MFRYCGNPVDADFPATGQAARQPVSNVRTGSLPNKKGRSPELRPSSASTLRRVEQQRGWYNNLPRWSHHKRHLLEGEPVEPTLKKLRVVITFTTTTDTSAIHGEYTDLREAVAYLRKLADEIEIELQREPRRTFNPAS